MKSYDVKPTSKQILTFNLIFSGKYRTVAAAMRAGGYSAKTAHRSREKFFRSRGFQVYLQSINKSCKKLCGMNLEEVTLAMAFEGLFAMKPFGPNAIMHPDWRARHSFTELLSKLFGWDKGNSQRVSIENQQNFFAVPEEEKDRFNVQFDKFLRKYYADENSE